MSRLEKIAELVRGKRSAIRDVIARRQLSIAYQPIVDMQTGKLFAYEALARSESPNFAGPLELIQAAIDDKCMGELGHILRQMTMEGCTDTTLFVNVNPNELDEGWLVRSDDPLFFHNEQVYLEITESVPLSHFEFCSSVLAEIRSKGVRLVIDDFGAGYSNLRYIAELIPDIVKLDMHLVHGIGHSTRTRKLVRSIVRLCTDMNSRVVAEGIEVKDDFEALRDVGVHFGQGFLLARPGFPPPPINWPVAA
jgi:EAL domain-containing protein (putative c-di-GMP-specific phosphodiesterase class I)